MRSGIVLGPGAVTTGAWLPDAATVLPPLRWTPPCAVSPTKPVTSPVAGVKPIAATSVPAYGAPVKRTSKPVSSSVAVPPNPRTSTEPTPVTASMAASIPARV